MRKYNVFGKKLSKTKALPFMILIFIVVIAGYYLITMFQTNQLESLRQEELRLRSEIEALLADENESTYLEIGEIMSILSQSFERASIENDLLIAKGIAALNDAENYRVDITDQVDYPLEEAVADSIVSVRINISFITDDGSSILTYVDTILDANYIYYIDSFNLTTLTDGSIQTSITFYTFYNAIEA